MMPQNSSSFSAKALAKSNIFPFTMPRSSRSNLASGKIAVNSSINYENISKMNNRLMNNYAVNFA